MTEEKTQATPAQQRSGCAGLPAGCLIIVAVLVVMCVVAVVTADPPAQPTAGNPPAASAPAEPPPPPSFTELLEKKARVKATEYTRGPYDMTKDPGGYKTKAAYLRVLSGNIDLATITWREDAYWTAASLRSTIHRKAAEILQLFCEGELPDLIVLTAEAEMVDTYGQKSWKPVVQIYIRKATVNKIVWANFLPGNLPKVAEYYWEHPAFSK